MPTYQYACTVCDERVEAVQSFTDAPLKECPACGGALRKVFSAVGVVFKGSGFYKNDSRDAPKKKKEGEKKEPVPAVAGASSSDSGSSAGKDSGSKDSGGKSSSDGSSKGAGSSLGGKPTTAKPATSGKPAERKSA